MSVKTVLVHLADDDHHRVRLDVGVRLAQAQQAHLVALFITFPVGMPSAVVGRGASAQYIAEAREIAREKAAKLEQEARQTCKTAGITMDWVVVDGEHLEELTSRAHVTDLCVISQSMPGEYLEDRFRMRLAEGITLTTGCPILMLPRIPEIPPFGRHIMVGWAPNREAVRALRDSMDFLTAADKVTVVSVGETPDNRPSESQVVEHLKRHGVNAEPLRVKAEGGVGETLLATGKKIGCDMIVMGAYGHSRLREIVLGGVTRHVFTHAEVPVLMSH